MLGRYLRSIRFVVLLLLTSLALNFLWICLTPWPSESNASVRDCPCLDNEDYDGTNRKDKKQSVLGSESLHNSLPASHSSAQANKHKLAVIVPFRDRFDELSRFVPHISRFLDRQGINYVIYIINQADEYRFNRASLINVGFLLSRNECDYIVMHDVDLLPLNKDLSYRFPSEKSGKLVSLFNTNLNNANQTMQYNTGGPIVHLASPEYHPKYHYRTFVGGILLVKRDDFELLNGLSNRYWGWGLEDDEFYARIKDAKLPLRRPDGLNSNANNTFLHIHLRSRKRDMAKLHNQKEVTRKRDRETGLNTVQFKITSESELTVDGYPARVIHVRLICDMTRTPWCQFPSAAILPSKPTKQKLMMVTKTSP